MAFRLHAPPETGGALGETRRLPGRRGSRARRPPRRPARARLHARRPHRPRRRHRPRRDRRRPPTCRWAGPTSRTAAATACSDARTRALFGYAVGPALLEALPAPAGGRPLAGPPRRARLRGRARDLAAPALAFVGVRACELAAILVQDRVFLGGPFVDPAYRARRESAFVVAVHCGSPAGTCFCASMGTGPKAGPGFDLALTELIDDGRHDLVVEVGHRARRGGGRGACPTAPPRPRTSTPPAAVLAAAERSMGRTLETEGLKELLYRHYEHPRWDEVAKRCLACANCTMVCPTCFCATVEDETDLTGSGRRAAAHLGLLLLAGVLLHPRRQRAHLGRRALPPVDDAQAGDLARPVRHLGLRRLRALHHLVPGRHRHHRGGPGRAPGRRAREQAVTIHTFEPILAEHPFFKDLPPPHLDTVVGCAANVVFEPGEFIFREGEAADRFFVVREGKVAVEIFAPNKGPVTIETVEDGEVLGWSWLFPPYKAVFDARALNAVRALVARRRVPAHEVREGPGARLRAAEALRRGRDLAPRGHPHAAPGPLWQRLSRVPRAPSPPPTRCGRSRSWCATSRRRRATPSP